MSKDIQDIYPLSPMQHGMLFHCLHSPEMLLYHDQVVYTFNGDLNIPAFKYACQEVTNHHPILRTSFYWEELDKPLQVVHRTVEVPIEYLDWQGIDSLQQKERLKSFLEQDRLQYFDFAQAPIMRVAIIKLAEDSYHLVYVSNLLVLDGWSVPLVLNDVVEIYEAYCQGQAIPNKSGSNFKDYIKWLERQDLTKAKAFWQQELQGFKEPTPLTNLYSHNLSEIDECYEDLKVSLTASSTEKLHLLAKQHRLTMNTLVQGAWAIMLAYYSGKNNIVYGCTTSGRPTDLEGSEFIVGEMVNTLPVHLQIDLDTHLMPWLQQLQTKLVEIREYEYYPLVDIQKYSEVPGNSTLFHSYVVFENQKSGKFLDEWGSLNITDTVDYYKTNYPLTIVGYPDIEELKIGINYDFRLFEATAIANILEHFKIVLEGMASNRDTTLRQLLSLTEQPRHLELLNLEREMSLNLKVIFN